MGEIKKQSERVVEYMRRIFKGSDTFESSFEPGCISCHGDWESCDWTADIYYDEIDLSDLSMSIVHYKADGNPTERHELRDLAFKIMVSYDE